MDPVEVSTLSRVLSKSRRYFGRSMELSKKTATTAARVTKDRIATRVPASGEFITSCDARLVAILNGPDKNHRYDLQTEAIIHRVLRPGDVAIDVGCHVGAILDAMIAAAPETRHIAFEPLPHLHADLIDKYPSIDIHQLALVAEPEGNLEFHHVVSNPGYSGILERRYDRPDETIELISVPTAKLDDIVPADVHPKLIKIDVEGAEMGVLQGGLATITRAKPLIVFEHGLGGSDIYGTTPEDIFEFFFELNMGVWLLGTFLDDGPPLGREQFSHQFNHGLNYYFVAASFE